MKFFLTALSLIAMIMVSAVAREYNVDSLKNRLSAAAEDTNKLILLSKLTESISDDEVWPVYNEQMGELAGKLALSSNSSIQKTAKKFLGAYYNNKAVLLFYRSDVPNALEFHHKGLKLREEVGDKKGIAESLNNIGYANTQQGEIRSALMSYRRSLVIEREIADTSGMGLTLNNIGVIYQSENNFPEALRYYFQSYTYREKVRDMQGMATTLNNIGVCYSKSNLLDSAIHNFQKSFAISEKIGNKRGMVLSITEIGRAYFKKDDLPKAKKYGQTAHELALKVGFPVRIKNTTQLLKDIYRQQGDYTKAFAMFELEIQMRDSMQNEETRKATLQQKLKYEFEKKETVLAAEQEKKDLIAQQELQRQKIIKNTFIGGVVVLMILVIGLINRYRFKHKSNEKLQEAYENLKAAQQQLIQQEKLASLGQLTASIAHEIKNPLNFVNNFSEVSSELLKELDTAISQEQRVEITENLKSNLLKIASHGKRADSIVRNMLAHSRNGDSEKVPADINLLCEETLNLAYHAMRANIPDFNCSIQKSLAQDLPRIPIVPQDISRVLLNLLNNAFYAVSSSNARRKEESPVVSISTEKSNNRIVIKVRDTGDGIPPHIQNKIFEPFFTTKPAGHGTGLGLSLSYDIIKAHGGDIKLSTKENQFTEFTIMLPV